MIEHVREVDISKVMRGWCRGTQRGVNESDVDPENINTIISQETQSTANKYSLNFLKIVFHASFCRLGWICACVRCREYPSSRVDLTFDIWRKLVAFSHHSIYSVTLIPSGVLVLYKKLLSEIFAVKPHQLQTSSPCKISYDTLTDLGQCVHLESSPDVASWW